MASASTRQALEALLLGHGEFVPELLPECARNGIDIPTAAVAEVGQALENELGRSFVHFDVEHQGTESDFSENPSPIIELYEKSARLLDWARTHGASKQVSEALRRLRARFPTETDGLSHYLETRRT
jgi:hypothetical protein